MRDTRSSIKIIPVIYRVGIVVLTGLLLLVLFLHAKKYLPFISDDSLISFRYSKRLLQGHGLTWTEGIPVEGYSNLLWVLLVAVSGFFTDDLILSARVLGFLCMAVVVITFVLYCYRSRRMTLFELVPVAAGGLFFVLSAPIAVWAIGGLEQALVAAILAPVLALNLLMLTGNEDNTRVCLSLSFCLGLLSITRVDGLIYTFMTLFALVIIKGIKKETIGKGSVVCIFPVLFTGAQIVFRRLYYKAWVPNTALVKVSPSLKHFKDGFGYVKDGYASLLPFSLIALLILLVMVVYSRKERAKAIFLFVVAGVWSAYLVFIGGDIFPAFRHFIPLVTVMTLIIIEGLRGFLQKYKTHMMRVSVCAFFIGMFVVFSFTHYRHLENIRPKIEQWEWHGQAIGLFLKKAFGRRQPLFAVNTAGCLPYWSELPSLDMLGLNDYYIPRNRPADLGQGAIGHELGNGRYILDRKPDLISFCGPGGSIEPCYRSGRELVEMKEFEDEYRLVYFKATVPMTFKARFWVRRYSPKIGIIYRDDSVTIPGYLFDSYPKPVCYLNEQERPVVSVTNKNPLIITDVRLPDEINDIQIVPHTSELEIMTEKLPAGTYTVSLATKNTAGVEIESVVIR